MWTTDSQSNYWNIDLLAAFVEVIPIIIPILVNGQNVAPVLIPMHSQHVRSTIYMVHFYH